MEHKDMMPLARKTLGRVGAVVLLAGATMIVGAGLAARERKPPTRIRKPKKTRLLLGVVSAEATPPPYYRFVHWTTDEGNVTILDPESRATDVEIYGPWTEPVTAHFVGPLGDLDKDGYIGHDDLVLFSVAWHMNEGENGYEPRADFNGDGAIDYEDLAGFAAVWHTRWRE